VLFASIHLVLMSDQVHLETKFKMRAVYKEKQNVPELVGQMAGGFTSSNVSPAAGTN
jgi:hypothetical protein